MIFRYDYCESSQSLVAITQNWRGDTSSPRHENWSFTQRGEDTRLQLSATSDMISLISILQVAIVLVGALSRWVNHLDDDEIEKPRTKTLLKALRASHEADIHSPWLYFPYSHAYSPIIVFVVLTPG